MYFGAMIDARVEAFEHRLRREIHLVQQHPIALRFITSLKKNQYVSNRESKLFTRCMAANNAPSRHANSP